MIMFPLGMFPLGVARGKTLAYTHRDCSYIYIYLYSQAKRHFEKS